MKKWPEKDGLADFEELANHLVAAVKHCYILQRKNEDKDVPYKGYEIGKPEQACCLNAKHQLTAKNLEYSLNNYGRSALEEIIGLAVRLGIEQGRRMTTKTNKETLDLIIPVLSRMRGSM